MSGTRRAGSGVIWDCIPYEPPVIPAKAGIQSVDRAFPRVCGVDSRFRGNDDGLERPCLANDTTSRRAELIDRIRPLAYIESLGDGVRPANRLIVFGTDNPYRDFGSW